MPPWGAVKGFGSFRNDQALNQEQIELIVSWVETGSRRGNNPLTLPKEPTFEAPAAVAVPPRAISISGEFVLTAPVMLDGILPERVPEQASMQIVARRPDGSVEPLVWLHNYHQAVPHPFLFRQPLSAAGRDHHRGCPAAGGDPSAAPRRARLHTEGGGRVQELFRCICAVSLINSALATFSHAIKGTRNDVELCEVWPKTSAVGPAGTCVRAGVGVGESAQRHRPLSRRSR